MTMGEYSPFTGEGNSLYATDGSYLHVLRVCERNGAMPAYEESPARRADAY